MESKFRKTIIVGDVHGCLDEFLLLLDKCNYKRELDQLVLVGDLVGKGKYGYDVVKWTRENNALCVIGNHDEVLLDVKNGERPLGGLSDTHRRDYSNLSEEDWVWLQNLPYYLELGPITSNQTETLYDKKDTDLIIAKATPFNPNANIIVVHAALKPGVPLREQSKKMMTRARNITLDGNLVEESVPDSAPWVSKWTDEHSHVVFGHDAVRGLQINPYSTGLDTGCCYGGLLSALVLPDWEILSIRAKEMYSKPNKPGTTFNVPA